MRRRVHVPKTWHRDSKPFLSRKPCAPWRAMQRRAQFLDIEVSQRSRMRGYGASGRASLRQRRMLIGRFVVRTKLLDFYKAHTFLSEGDALLEQKSSKKILHHHTVTRSRHSKD